MIQYKFEDYDIVYKKDNAANNIPGNLGQLFDNAGSVLEWACIGVNRENGHKLTCFGETKELALESLKKNLRESYFVDSNDETVTTILENIKKDDSQISSFINQYEVDEHGERKLVKSRPWQNAIMYLIILLIVLIVAFLIYKFRIGVRIK